MKKEESREEGEREEEEGEREGLKVDQEQVEAAEFRPQSWERVPGGCGSCRTILGRRGSTPPCQVLGDGDVE